MQIDPRSMHHEKYRPFSVIGAVARVLDQIEVGASLDVDSLCDARGKILPLSRLQMYVGRLADGRVFSVRKRDGGFATVYRFG